MAMAQPKYVEARPRISNPRRAQSATKSRIVKSNRARYTGLLRVGAVIGITLVALMAYVMLTSNVTSMTYALAKAQHKRTLLQEQTARLDERLAIMRSDDRLAAIAAKIGMNAPQLFVVVQLAPPQTVARQYPVLDSIAGVFHAR
jgi:hypothetical protein